MTRDERATDGSRSFFRRPATLLFLLALGVRLIHLLQIRAAPFFTLLTGDARGYDTWAREIASGQLLGSEVFYQAPLYPYVLAAIYSVTGGDLLAARIVQALMGAASCVLLAFAGRRFFSDRVGWIAGATLAVYPPAIFFDGLIQKAALSELLLCALLALLAGTLQEASRGRWLAIGATLGALALTRENALVFLPAVLAWAAFGRPHRAGRARSTAFLTLGLVCVLLPVALRNLAVGGEFHLTTSQLGTDLYIGNNPLSDGTYQALRQGRGAPEFERRDATVLAERALGRELSPREVSAYWAGQAIDWATEHPGDWLALLSRKLALLVNRVEQVDTEGQYVYAEWSWPLRIGGPLLHLGLLVPLATFGLWVTWSRRRELWVLYLMAGLYAVSVVTFYVFARYRYPLVPFLVLFSAAAVVGARGFLADADRRRRTLALATTLLAVAAANWPVVSVARMKATTLSNLGGALVSAGDLEMAETYYRRALTLAPDFGSAHYNLGILAQMRGDPAAAVEHYRSAIEVDPGNARAHSNLAGHLLASGDLDGALDHCRRALEIEPDLAPTLVIRGRALAAQGQRDASIEAFREALAVDPRNASALTGLVAGQRAAGRDREALADLERALQAAPDSPLAASGLAWMLATHRDPALRDARRAVELAERAASMSPEPTVGILDTLAAAYAAQGDFDRAVTTAESALARASGPRAGAIRQRLALYRQARPYREGS